MSKLIVSAKEALKTEKRTKDTKANRQYFFLKVVDAANPFTGYSLKIEQKHSPDGKTSSWSGYGYSQVQLGMELEGEIVRSEVEGYQIPDGKGGNRTATHFTCVVLKGQDLSSVLKQNGKKLVVSAPIVKEVTV